MYVLSHICSDIRFRTGELEKSKQTLGPYKFLDIDDNNEQMRLCGTHVHSNECTLSLDIRYVLYTVHCTCIFFLSNEARSNHFEGRSNCKKIALSNSVKWKQNRNERKRNEKRNYD